MYLFRGAGRTSRIRTAPTRSDAPGSPPGPRPGCSLTEPLRGLVDLAALPLAAPWLAAAPRGDGHGVLVLPGPAGLRHQHAARCGGSCGCWATTCAAGSSGATAGRPRRCWPGCPGRCWTTLERTGGPVSLVGWSLGGVYAREMARRHPGQVRQVITLGSPFALRDPAAEPRPRPLPAPQSPARGRRPAAHHRAARPAHRRAVDLGLLPPGRRRVLAGLHGTGDRALHQNVEVRCSHLGFGVDPATLWLIADRLAVPPGQHRPFRPPPLLRPVYPDRR